MTEEFDPVVGPEPDSPRLATSPLARVIFQVRFPDILSVQSSGAVAGFQDAVRASYPVLAREAVGSSVNSDGSSGAETIWRMQDADGIWRLSLGTGFASVETRVYSGRSDFCSRIEMLMEALEATIRPSHSLRLGIRYVNHFGIGQPGALPGFLRPGMIGPAAIAGLEGGRLGHTMSEASFRTDEGRLSARWGMLPPGATHDAQCMPPAPETSLFLDIDASSERPEGPIPLEVRQATATAKVLVGRCYTFFRWSVSDAFMDAFGRQSVPLPISGTEGQFSIH